MTKDPNETIHDSRSADEAEALKSLDDTRIDDTSIRPFTAENPLWRTSRRTTKASTTPQTTTLSRGRLYLLLAAVASVSFVAGGVTARLGAQMPLLIPQQSSTHEASLTLEEPVEPVAEVSETVTEEPTQPETGQTAPPSYDTGYDDTQVDDSTSDGGSDDELSWTWDDSGDRSFSYDDDSNSVTLDYDGYSLTFTLDDLLDEEDEGSGNSYPIVTQDDDSSSRRWDNGYGTGYDHEEERDYYGWGRRSSLGSSVTS